VQNFLTTSRPHVVRFEGEHGHGFARGEDELDLVCGTITIDVHNRPDIAVGQAVLRDVSLEDDEFQLIHDGDLRDVRSGTAPEKATRATFSRKSAPLPSLKNLFGIQGAHLGGRQCKNDGRFPGRRSEPHAKSAAAFVAMDHGSHVALPETLPGNVLIQDHLFSHGPRSHREEAAGVSAPDAF
jgi:hypothetical protein